MVSNDLNQMNYKQLQSLAKSYGIKANQSSAVLLSLLKQVIDESSSSSISEEVSAQTIEAVVSAQPIEEVISSQPIEEVVSSEPIEEVVSAETIETVVSLKKQVTTLQVESTEYQVSLKVQVLRNNEWVNATILRINKKSIRVVLSDNDEVTVKYNEIRHAEDNNDDEQEQDLVPPCAENIINNNAITSLFDIDDMVDNNNSVSSLADIDESCPISHESLVEALMSEVKYSDIVDTDIIDEPVTTEATEMDEDENEVENMNMSVSNINQSFAGKQIKSVEWNSSAKVSNTFDQAVNEFNPKKRKSFSNTPVSKVSKPAYEVKLTKAQALRTQSNKMKVQAIENRRLEDNTAKNPFDYVNRQKSEQAAIVVPVAKKQTVSEIRSTSSIGNRNPLTSIKSVRPVTAPITKPLAVKSVSSNFKKDHEKIFMKQKSIADICKRDDNIGINMSRALEVSKQQGFKANPIFKRASTSNIYDKENSISATSRESVNVTHRNSHRASAVQEVNNKLNMIQYR